MAADVAPQQERGLLVRLPCNPIFPIGPIYLADHLHKQFPQLQKDSQLLWRPLRIAVDIEEKEDG